MIIIKNKTKTTSPKKREYKSYNYINITAIYNENIYREAKNNGTEQKIDR